MNDISRKWFKIWEKSHYPSTVPGFGVILSMYSPHFLDDAERDANGLFTAGVTLGVFKHWDDKGKKEKHNAILFSMFPPAILNPAEVIIHTKNLCHDYLNNSKIKVYEGWSPDLLLVPAQEATKSTLISQIVEGGADVAIRRFYYANEGKNLENILSRALPRMAEGRLWVASNPMDSSEIRNMDAKFLATICSYPNEVSRATVWALAQAVVYLENYGVFKDGYERDNTTRPKHKLYGP